MKIAKLALAAVALTTTAAVAPGVAVAQEATASVAAGATVYGNDGAEIGTVESVQGETVILVVDDMKAPVPANAFGSTEKGTSLNATKAQIVGMLQAARQEAIAKRAALVVGADAVTAKNAPLGTVLEINGDNVIIARGGDEMSKVTLLREHFAAGPNGELMALLTNAQIDAAMAASTPATESAGG